MLVGFIIFAPLTNNKTLITTNIVLLGYLSLKWLTGSDNCGLTELEYRISGKPYGQGFLYRLLNGVIKLEENKFNKVIIIVTVIWLIINIIIYMNMEKRV
jgi:hypothetical protein